jgi:hypothetical protein
MTTTEVAFRLTLNSLTNHLSGQSRVFFWTFTTPEPLEKEQFTTRWNTFVLYIKRAYPLMPWLRVFEVHPGEEGDFNGHGLHAHAVFPQFRKVETIRKLALQAGLGRIHVKVLPIAKARNYLAKYLGKTKRASIPYLRGARLWASINFDGKTRCRDVIRQTFRSWLFKLLFSANAVERLNEVNPLLGGAYIAIVGYLRMRFKDILSFFNQYYDELIYCFSGQYNWHLWEIGEHKRRIYVF